MPGHVGFLPGAGLGGNANYIQCWRSVTERGRRSGETNTSEQDRTGFGVVQKHTFMLETELWQTGTCGKRYASVVVATLAGFDG
ncbi:hypothetical protein E5D57_001114 [Metarhizium anisopliae]|nr:hypothetical protein E5D57_001114 [Metarhizium anisopliae]